MPLGLEGFRLIWEIVIGSANSQETSERLTKDLCFWLSTMVVFENLFGGTNHYVAMGFNFPCGGYHR
jgi:hypothetical protein